MEDTPLPLQVYQGSDTDFVICEDSLSIVNHEEKNPFKFDKSNPSPNHSGNLGNKFALHNQIATVYENKNQFDCGICQLPFSSKQSYIAHISTVHFRTQFSGKEKNPKSDGKQNFVNTPQFTPYRKESSVEKQPSKKEQLM